MVMNMKVLKYECPNCGYTKAPTTHRGCENGAGQVMKIGGKFTCDACGETVGTGVTCSSCGESVPDIHMNEIEMEL